VSAERPAFRYEGLVYARPVGRGIILGDPADLARPQLDDAVEDFLTRTAGRPVGSGNFNARVRITVELADEPDATGASGTARDA